MPAAFCVVDILGNIRHGKVFLLAKKVSKLTRKQQLFLDKYLLTGNKAASYRDVYKCKASTARTSAWKTLRRPVVKRRLEEMMALAKDKVIDKWVANANDIMHEDSLMATRRVGDILDEEGLPKEMKDWPAELRASIKNVEYEHIDVMDHSQDPPQMIKKKVIKKIWFEDKGAALGRMEKVLGLIKDENHDNSINFNFVKVLLQKIDGQNRGKLPQDCT